MKNERAFGLMFAAVFLVVACWPLVSGAAPRLWALAVAAALAAIALAAPRWLSSTTRLWMRFGELLHRIVSPVVLAVMFYGVVLPTGLVMRALRRDPLRLRFDRQARSYWMKRDPPGPRRESFRDQF